MKNKIKLSLLAALMLSVMLFLMVPLGAGAASADYSKPGATEKITLNSADILERILQVEDPSFALTPGERAYLAEFGSETVSYSAEIPYLNNVLTAYDEAANTVSVTAFEYEYVTATGITMHWKPYSVTVGNTEAPLIQNGVEYTASVNGPFTEGTDSVKVLYKTVLPAFNARVINSLLNKAYNDVIIWDEYAQYLDRLNEYNAALNAYNTYLAELDAYEQRYSEYSVYLEELEKYDAAYKEYMQYESDLKKYNEEYALYRQYIDDVNEYEKNVLLYNKYVENSKKVKAQLAIVEGMMKNTVITDENTGLPMSRQLYGAITGPTVGEVLDNKSLIAGDHTGISGEEVDVASDATEKLRVLFKTYFSFTTEEEKYTYYALNYKEFESNLIILLRQLDLFYSNGKIRAGLGTKNLKQKYEILLAQLYYTVNAISDKPVLNYDGSKYYNSVYTFNGKTALNILGGDAYMSDKNNATPVEGGYPTPIEEPSPVPEVKEPQKPTAVKRPIAPEEVAAPGERPEAVTRPKPIASMDPPSEFFLEDPLILPESVVSLVEEYRLGKIVERAAKTQSVRIEAAVYSTKKFKNTDEIVIRFFDEAGNQLTTAFSVERGSFVEYEGSAPEKAEDDYATYKFVGWKNGPGADAERVNMSAIDCSGSELNLYPYFEVTEKLYKVSWSTQDGVAYTYAPLGSIPNPPFVPDTKVDETSPNGFTVKRVFDRWVDEEGEPTFSGVQKDEEENLYFAQYNDITLMSVVSSDGVKAVTVTLNEGVYSIDCTESVEDALDIATLVDHISGRGALKIKANGYEILFSSAEVLRMRDEGVSSLSLVENHTSTTDRFVFCLVDIDGAEMSGITAEVLLPWSFSDPDNMELYYIKDGDRVRINRTVGGSGATLSARITCGVEYTAITEYIVDLIAQDVISLGIASSVLCAGEDLVITYTTPLGVAVTSVYMLLDSGERVELALGEGGAITVPMPASRISVGAEIKYLEYKITFVATDTVVSERTYRYGEMPTVPTAPQKASDGVYTYEFIGWDREIVSVTGDATYTAVYESTLIPPKEEEKGLQLSESVWAMIHRLAKVCVPLGVVCIIVLPVSIISAVILIVNAAKKQRKKRR